MLCCAAPRMTRDMHQPHDRLFRKVFSEPAEAAGLLRAHVPSWLADTLNWSSLTLMNDSYVDDDLRASESDLLYAVEQRPAGVRRGAAAGSTGTRRRYEDVWGAADPGRSSGRHPRQIGRADSVPPPHRSFSTGLWPACSTTIRMIIERQSRREPSVHRATAGRRRGDTLAPHGVLLYDE